MGIHGLRLCYGNGLNWRLQEKVDEPEDVDGEVDAGAQVLPCILVF